MLLPGLVDTHVHVNEPGRTEWEGFATATRAAAAGGVTTIIDMPLNSLPPTVDVPALEVKRAVAAEKAYVDVGFWGGAIPGNIGSLKGLHEAGVFGFKCFLLDSGVPEFPPLMPADLHDYLTAIREFDGLMIVHAEDAEAIEHSPAAHGSRYAEFLRPGHGAPRTPAIAHVIEAARWTGARVHILHLSSSDALPMIASAKRDGVRLTVETCPHYLVFDAEEIADGATQFKCCPPIREPENRDLLWQGLADGIIDCVVSDHSPVHAGAQATGHRRLRRRLGRHRRAAGGVARGVDPGPRPRLHPGRRRPLDVRDARRARRPGPQGRPGRRQGRRPRGLRAGPDVRGRRGRASASQSHHPLRGSHARRRGAQHVVARPGTGRRTEPRPTHPLRRGP